MNQKPDPFADPDGHSEWLIQETIRRMAHDADRQQTVKERSALALGDTEREIFAETFGQDAYQEGIDLDELSQTEGIDGGFLSDEEQMAAAIQGEIPGYLGDRPLQYQHELDVDADNQRLRAENEALRRAQPQPTMTEEQRDIARGQYLDQHGLMSYDPAKTDAFAAQIQTAQNELNWHRNERVRQSIEAQRAEFGDQAVDRAIADYMRLQGTAIGQSINDHTYASPNPGRTFLSFMHDSDVVESIIGDQHPHMRTGRARASRMPRMRASEQEEYSSGYGDADTEQEIMDAAFDR